MRGVGRMAGGEPVLDDRLGIELGLAVLERARERLVPGRARLDVEAREHGLAHVIVRRLRGSCGRRCGGSSRAARRRAAAPRRARRRRRPRAPRPRSAAGAPRSLDTASIACASGDSRAARARTRSSTFAPVASWRRARHLGQQQRVAGGRRGSAASARRARSRAARRARATRRRRARRSRARGGRRGAPRPAAASACATRRGSPPADARATTSIAGLGLVDQVGEERARCRRRPSARRRRRSRAARIAREPCRAARAAPRTRAGAARRGRPASARRRPRANRLTRFITGNRRTSAPRSSRRERVDVGRRQRERSRRSARRPRRRAS